jgi:simple sugar transport system ATP-binding protein
MGIATVFQDLAMLPLMSITRNFFLGREPRKRVGPVEVFDSPTAGKITNEELNIAKRDPSEAGKLEHRVAEELDRESRK